MKSKLFVLSVIGFIFAVVTITNVIMANKEIEAWRNAARNAFIPVGGGMLKSVETPDELAEAIVGLDRRPTLDQYHAAIINTGK